MSDLEKRRYIMGMEKRPELTEAEIQAAVNMANTPDLDRSNQYDRRALSEDEMRERQAQQYQGMGSAWRYRHIDKKE